MRRSRLRSSRRSSIRPVDRYHPVALRHARTCHRRAILQRGGCLDGVEGLWSYRRLGAAADSHHAMRPKMPPLWLTNGERQVGWSGRSPSCRARYPGGVRSRNRARSARERPAPQKPNEPESALMTNGLARHDSPTRQAAPCALPGVPAAAYLWPGEDAGALPARRHRPAADRTGDAGRGARSDACRGRAPGIRGRIQLREPALETGRTRAFMVINHLAISGRGPRAARRSCRAGIRPGGGSGTAVRQGGAG